LQKFSPKSSNSFRNSKSRSKNKRSSSKKLFEKAHMTSQGETYLKSTKKHKDAKYQNNGRMAGQSQSPKGASLALQKELDIKIQNKNSA
jgi:hypothetical protein